MKFTRMFILKAINNKYYECLEESRENLMLAIKDLIICNNHLDLLINFCLAFLVIFTSYSSNNIFTEQNSINFYLICKIIINLSLYYIVIQTLIIFLINPPTSFKIMNIDNNNIENNSQNNNINIYNNYEPLLINSLIPKVIYLTKTITLPQIIFQYWHTFNSIFHFLKNSLFLLNYGCSIIFWQLFINQRQLMNNKDYFKFHFFFLELFNFYSLFKMCFYLIKAFINFSLIPIYISSIYLGYIEDKFNEQLNNLCNTREYHGRQSLRSQGSNLITSEIDDSCSICLNPFNIGDTISTLPCSKRHTFHTICLEEWFYSNVSCPLCRCDFNDKIGGLIPNNNRRRNNQVRIPMQDLDGNQNPFQ